MHRHNVLIHIIYKNVFRYFLFMFVCLFVVLSTCSWNNSTPEPRRIRIGVYENSPKLYTDEEGEVKGFWPDIIRDIGEHENWRIEWVHGTWDECLDRLSLGEIDLMPDVAFTTERAQRYAFNEEMVINSWSRVYVPENSSIETILDLEGKTIAGLNGSSNFDGPDGIKNRIENFGIQSSFVAMESYDDVFAAIESGNVDAGVTNKEFGNLNEQKYNVKRTSIIYQPVQIKFAMPKNGKYSPYLIETIDIYIQDYKKHSNSIYYQALEQHFGENRSQNMITIFPEWAKLLFVIAVIAILFLGAVSVSTRIQVQKQTADLLVSEKRYETLANVSPVGIFRTDEKGLTTYVNPTWVQMAELPPEKAMGNQWLDIVHPDDRKKIAENWQNSTEQKKTSLADYRFVHKDGSVTWVIGQAVPEYNEKNEIVGYVGTITDITQRKNDEAAIQSAMDAERKALAIARTIQDANLALSQVLDLHEVLGVLLDYLYQLVPYDRAVVMAVEENDSLRVLLLRSSQMVESKNISKSVFNKSENPVISKMLDDQKSVLIRHTKDDKNWNCPISDDYGGSWLGVPLIATGKVMGLFALYRIHDQAFTADEQQLADALAAQAAIAMQNGRLHDELQGYAAELEERVQERTTELEKRISQVVNLNEALTLLTEDLSEAVEKAESADRLKSAFLATMSHELRTPLNSIIGFTGILLQKMVGELNSEQDKQLRMVQRSAYHLLDLINDVLDISKIEAGQIDLHPSTFNFQSSVQNSIDKITPLAVKKDLSLKLDLPSEEIMIYADQRRVEQILINLLNNGVKFTDKGSITLKGEVIENQLIIHIIDTGIGISKENAENLFMPFRQIDTGIARQYEGTGLGLSICKRLVNLMDGEIGVDSEPGKGSDFYFNLPLSRNEP
jgi:PAS domain S-box-containing protein